MSLDSRIAVVTTREKIFFPTKRFLDQSPKKMWKIIDNSKIVSPQKLPRIHRLRVSQLWQKFSLEVNIRSQSEKRANFSLLKKFFINCSRGRLLLFCQPWKSFSILVPKTSKIFRKSSSFQDFHSENLLCKCSTGHVKVFLTTLPKTFLQKHRFFLSKSKKDQKPIVQQFFLTFLPRYTQITVSTHLTRFFAKIRKKNHWKSQKRW